MCQTAQAYSRVLLTPPDEGEVDQPQISRRNPTTAKYSQNIQSLGGFLYHGIHLSCLTPRTLNDETLSSKRSLMRRGWFSGLWRRKLTVISLHFLPLSFISLRSAHRLISSRSACSDYDSCAFRTSQTVTLSIYFQ